MNRVIKFILLIAAAVLVSGCAKSYKDIRVTSLKLVSVSPRGITGIDVLVELGIDNPIAGFEVFDLSGILKMDGKPCLNITADQLVVQGSSSKVYRIPLVGELDGSFNPLMLVTLFQNMDPTRFTADISARVNLRGGVGKVIELKDQPLDILLERGKNMIGK